MKKHHSTSTAAFTQSRAASCKSNSPIISLTIIQYKDTNNLSKSYGIIRRHSGIAYVIHAFMSFKKIGEKQI